MKVTLVKFERRYNVAQYEHEDYSVTAVVEDGDNAVEVLIQLKADVATAYGGEAAASAPPAIADPSLKKEKKSKKAEKKEPEPEAEEENDDETPSEEEEESEEAEEAEEEEEAPAKTSKKFKKKPQTYSRSNESHKEIYSNILKAVAPDWKKTAESKEKAKEVSKKMEGEEFLDEHGEVLPTFKDVIKKLMLGKKK